ncbi:monocarboxylate transporter [Ophiostoma piceae UAMH 11346]|uniref:Monocarboxylate transporter n=1 Tax=Ophiostoma piceae (strain UAMH 11346) TaxID=1262450 RepID=S3CCS7_OPHP1|nr:monocarboxylate transporter [Ophiostoma piceae UAMH 11346]
MFAVYGLANCLGLFLTYYVQGPLKTQNASTVSWIITVELYLQSASAIFWGRLYDVYGPRWILYGGSICYIFGLMMTSLSTQYYQIFLAQSILVSVSSGAVFNAALTSAATWFSKRRAAAMGILVSGSSVGGVILTILFHNLKPKVGFAWTAEDAGISTDLSAYLLSIINGSGFFGRIVPGFAADYFGRYNTMTVITSLCAVFTLALWIPAGTPSAIVAYGVIFGFTSGGFVSIGAPCIAQISDIRELGTRVGTAYILQALGGLLGSPIAGSLVTSMHGSYLGLKIFCGVSMSLGVFFNCLARAGREHDGQMHGCQSYDTRRGVPKVSERPHERNDENTGADRFSIVQYLEQRLTELQRLVLPHVQHHNTPQHQTSHGQARHDSNSHVLAVDIIALSISNTTHPITTRLLQGQTNLPYQARLFYPSERPPLKIPVRGIYHDTHPRTAGASCSAQFAHFVSTRIPVDVFRRLFDNYREDILPRFPCFLEEDLMQLFQQFHDDCRDESASTSSCSDETADKREPGLHRFVVPMILAISSLTSKSHNFAMIAGLSEALQADAMQHATVFLCHASLPSLQCMLLLIQLGLMLPYTTNLWFLTGEAMRLAVGLGLHIEPDPELVPNTTEAELRRRIFWVAYQLDRTVGISGGCPIALSDEHITTQLPYRGGDPHKTTVNSHVHGPSLCKKQHQKETEFLLHTRVRVLQSSIHAVQFFDHRLPDNVDDYNAWVLQTEQAIQRLANLANPEGKAIVDGACGSSSIQWLLSAAYQCRVLLNRPCSRNLTVSEPSLLAAVTAAIQLLTSYEALAGAGGFLITFEIANSAFHSGIFLLFALRNHAGQLKEAVLFDNAQRALQLLIALLNTLSKRWPALGDTSAYVQELLDTNLRNPLGHSGNAYDMNVLEELDCLVTQRRIHSIYHRNIPLPPSQLPRSFDSSVNDTAPAAHDSDMLLHTTFDNESWWQDFVHEDFPTALDSQHLAIPSPTASERQPNTTSSLGDGSMATPNSRAPHPPAPSAGFANMDSELSTVLDARPACSFCRDRRVKCSRELPVCRECKRTSRTCLVFDPVLEKNIPLSANPAFSY